MGTVNTDTSLWQVALLTCGVIAPLVQFASDRITGALVKGYDFSADSMSDLCAAGSSVRPLVLALTLVVAALTAAFAIGVFQSGTLPVRIVAVLIAANPMLTLVSSVFFPNTLGIRPSFGTPGVLLMAFAVLCFVLAMIVGAFAFAGWMRWLSVGIPVAYVLLTVVRYATAGTTPATMYGVQERTMVYTYLLWMMALAFHLLYSTGLVHRLTSAPS